MSTTDIISSISTAFTALAAVIALIAFIYAWLQSQYDKRRQRAAQTREELRAIIGDCNRFLRPLSQNYPYPIFHTAASITKEFCSRMSNPPKREEVQKILYNKELLLSVCVEGWVASTQIGRMLDTAEELERKASSRYLRGKLLLICHASFMLAGLVAKICSPESFYKLLSELDLPNNSNQNAEDELNTITIELQKNICKAFTAEYQGTIKRSLYFMQTAANAFIDLKDKELVQLAEYQGLDAPLSNATDPDIKTDPIIKIEQEALLLNRVKWVKRLLKGLEQDIHNNDYNNLCELINPIEEACIVALEASSFKQKMLP